MDNEIEIREMKESDLDEALQLWRISFTAGFSSSFDTKETLIKYLSRNPGLSSVACTKDGKVIGALMCGHDGRRGSIYNTAVYNEYRKKVLEERWNNAHWKNLKRLALLRDFFLLTLIILVLKSFGILWVGLLLQQLNIYTRSLSFSLKFSAK